MAVVVFATLACGGAMEATKKRTSRGFHSIVAVNGGTRGADIGWRGTPDRDEENGSGGVGHAGIRRRTVGDEETEGGGGTKR